MMGCANLFPFTLVVFAVELRVVCVTGVKPTVLIHTTNGPIKGTHFTSLWTNQSIYAFLGIPYAAPPVGDLRFKDPVPAAAWSDVRDCTREQPACPQTTTSGAAPLTTSEDCLYINVYTPQLPLPGVELLPALVWIHGGAFIQGSGNYDQNGPDLLVAEEVVVVTFNYRLGALGFLNLGVEDVSGNMGLKDQRLALMWVSSEIRHFGGDPSKVTIFGESAGAISIHFHYLSPLSMGLFHAAICDSGSPLAYRVRLDGRPHALQLAQHLNCGADNTSAVVACLRAANYQDIVRAQGLVKAPQDDKTGLTVFVPTIDKHRGKQSFLPDFPYNLMKEKKAFFVPFLMGVNSKEGIIRLFRSEEEIRNVTNNLEYLYALQVPEDKVCPPKLKAERIKQFYFRDTSTSDLHADGYVDLYTDVLYAYATITSARNYQNSTKVFIYYFTFDGRYKDKFVEKIQKKYNVSGVCHAEELNYLFAVKSVNQNVAYSDESTTWRRMVKMWTNFAKYGAPTVGPDPLLQDVTWQPACGGGTDHLIIDSDLQMASDELLGPRAALWDSITFNQCL